MPQFHSSVVVAVHRSPLIPSATHAVALTCANGIGYTFAWIKKANTREQAIQITIMAVPE